MSGISVVAAWIVATLAIGTLAGVLAKRYGIEMVIGAFAALVALANIIASKAVSVGPFVAPAGIVVYSTSFLITDIVSEKWGKDVARRAVWAGFLGNLILVVSVPIAIAWKAAPFVEPDFSRAYARVLGSTPRIVFASMVAYLLSQHHDVWAFHLWKKKTRGKHLWLRNCLSTVVSQFIDSVVFVSLAFYGVMPVIPLILGQWALKALIAALDTPFCYIACGLIDRVPQRSCKPGEG